MLKFYETYADDEKLSTVWSELSWSINRKIMSIKDAIKQHPANLKKEGLIERVGSTKSGHREVIGE